MKQIGKKGKEWLKIRRQWIKDNPPSFEGFYTCYLCNKEIPADELTLDHVVSRGRGGSSRYENLNPAHYICNTSKGSQGLDKYTSRA